MCSMSDEQDDRVQQQRRQTGLMLIQLQNSERARTSLMNKLTWRTGAQRGKLQLLPRGKETKGIFIKKNCLSSPDVYVHNILEFAWRRESVKRLSKIFSGGQRVILSYKPKMRHEKIPCGESQLEGR